MHFNSIKVRLEQNPFTPSLVLTQFQFHKGAIRTQYYPLEPSPSLHFNSIKVRLEQNVLGAIKDASSISIP